eukprot:g1937.t1
MAARARAMVLKHLGLEKSKCVDMPFLHTNSYCACETTSNMSVMDLWNINEFCTACQTERELMNANYDDSNITITMTLEFGGEEDKTTGNYQISLTEDAQTGPIVLEQNGRHSTQIFFSKRHELADHILSVRRSKSGKKRAIRLWNAAERASKNLMDAMDGNDTKNRMDNIIKRVSAALDSEHSGLCAKYEQLFNSFKPLEKELNGGKRKNVLRTSANSFETKLKDLAHTSNVEEGVSGPETGLGQQPTVWSSAKNVIPKSKISPQLPRTPYDNDNKCLDPAQNAQQELSSSAPQETAGSPQGKKVDQVYQELKKRRSRENKKRLDWTDDGQFCFIVRLVMHAANHNPCLLCGKTPKFSCGVCAAVEHRDRRAKHSNQHQCDKGSESTFDSRYRRKKKCDDQKLQQHCDVTVDVKKGHAKRPLQNRAVAEIIDCIRSDENYVHMDNFLKQKEGKHLLSSMLSAATMGKESIPHVESETSDVATAWGTWRAFVKPLLRSQKDPELHFNVKVRDLLSDVQRARKIKVELKHSDARRPSLIADAYFTRKAKKGKIGEGNADHDRNDVMNQVGTSGKLHGVTVRLWQQDQQPMLIEPTWKDPIRIEGLQGYEADSSTRQRTLIVPTNRETAGTQLESLIVIRFANPRFDENCVMKRSCVSLGKRWHTLELQGNREYLEQYFECANHVSCDEIRDNMEILCGIPAHFIERNRTDAERNVVRDLRTKLVDDFHAKEGSSRESTNGRFVLPQYLPARASPSDRRKAQIIVVNVLESLFETVPQLLLQMYTFLAHDLLTVEVFVLSMASAIVSLCAGLYNYVGVFEQLKDEEQDSKTKLFYSETLVEQVERAKTDFQHQVHADVSRDQQTQILPNNEMPTGSIVYSDFKVDGMVTDNYILHKTPARRLLFDARKTEHDVYDIIPRRTTSVGVMERCLCVARAASHTNEERRCRFGVGENTRCACGSSYSDYDCDYDYVEAKSRSFPLDAVQLKVRPSGESKSNIAEFAVKAMFEQNKTLSEITDILAISWRLAAFEESEAELKKILAEGKLDGFEESAAERKKLLLEGPSSLDDGLIREPIARMLLNELEITTNSLLIPQLQQGCCHKAVAMQCEPVNAVQEDGASDICLNHLSKVRLLHLRHAEAVLTPEYLNVLLDFLPGEHGADAKFKKLTNLITEQMFTETCFAQFPGGQITDVTIIQCVNSISFTIELVYAIATALSTFRKHAHVTESDKQLLSTSFDDLKPYAVMLARMLAVAGADNSLYGGGNGNTLLSNAFLHDVKAAVRSRMAMRDSRIVRDEKKTLMSFSFSSTSKGGICYFPARQCVMSLLNPTHCSLNEQAVKTRSRTSALILRQHTFLQRRICAVLSLLEDENHSFVKFLLHDFIEAQFGPSKSNQKYILAACEESWRRRAAARKEMRGVTSEKSKQYGILLFLSGLQRLPSKRDEQNQKIKLAIKWLGDTVARRRPDAPQTVVDHLVGDRGILENIARGRNAVLLASPPSTMPRQELSVPFPGRQTIIFPQTRQAQNFLELMKEEKAAQQVDSVAKAWNVSLGRLNEQLAMEQKLEHAWMQEQECKLAEKLNMRETNQGQASMCHEMKFSGVKDIHASILESKGRLVEIAHTMKVLRQSPRALFAHVVRSIPPQELHMILHSPEAKLIEAELFAGEYLEYIKVNAISARLLGAYRDAQVELEYERLRDTTRVAVARLQKATFESSTERRATLAGIAHALMHAEKHGNAYGTVEQSIDSEYERLEKAREESQAAEEYLRSHTHLCTQSDHKQNGNERYLSLQPDLTERSNDNDTPLGALDEKGGHFNVNDTNSTESWWSQRPKFQRWTKMVHGMDDEAHAVTELYWCTLLGSTDHLVVREKDCTHLDPDQAETNGDITNDPAVLRAADFIHGMLEQDKQKRRFLFWTPKTAQIIEDRLVQMGLTADGLKSQTKNNYCSSLIGYETLLVVF